MVQGYPNVGMTTAERWYEVARMVERGSAFTVAVYNVFGRSVYDVVGTGWSMFVGAYSDGDSYADDDMEYRHRYMMLSLFLALEAEDEEGIAKCKHGLTACVACTGEHGGTWISPPTADVVAEEEPILGTVDNGPVKPGTFDGVDRRRTWNQKVADGLRKWAHWMEERF